MKLKTRMLITFLSLLLPVAIFALERVPDKILDSITAQSGVTLDFLDDASVSLDFSYMSWGDSDGNAIQEVSHFATREEHESSNNISAGEQNPDGGTYTLQDEIDSRTIQVGAQIVDTSYQTGDIGHIRMNDTIGIKVTIPVGSIMTFDIDGDNSFILGLPDAEVDITLPQNIELSIGSGLEPLNWESPPSETTILGNLAFQELDIAVIIPSRLGITVH
jgi:hypothetical protein